MSQCSERSENYASSFHFLINLKKSVILTNFLEIFSNAYIHLCRTLVYLHKRKLKIETLDNSIKTERKLQHIIEKFKLRILNGYHLNYPSQGKTILP